MAGVEQGNVGKEKFTEEVARYECVYQHNSKDFKDKNKKGNCWEKIGDKFNLSTAEAVVKNCVRSLSKRLKMLPSGSGGDAVPREFQNLERLNPHIAHRPSSKNLRSKSPAETVESSSSPRSGNEDACNFDFSADQNVGKSRLCHRSRSSAIIWKPALNDGLYGKL